MVAMAPNQLALRHEDAIRQLEELAELLQGRHDALREAPGTPSRRALNIETKGSDDIWLASDSPRHLAGQPG